MTSRLYKFCPKFQELRQQIKADIKKQHDLYVKLVGDIKAFIGIPTVRGKTIRVSLLSKGEMVMIWLSETLNAKEFSGQLIDVVSKTSESEIPLFEKSAPPMSNIHVSNEGVIK